MARGGKREGAGKPRQSELGIKKNVTFRLAPEAIQKLEILSKELDKPKNKVIEDLILTYLDFFTK